MTEIKQTKPKPNLDLFEDLIDADTKESCSKVGQQIIIDGENERKINEHVESVAEEKGVRKEDLIVQPDAEYGHAVMLPSGHTGKDKPKQKRLSLTRPRGKDKKIKDIKQLYGSTQQGLYATDNVTSRLAFENKTSRKPKWAVDGCVLLRDCGMCGSCGERIGKGYEIVQIIPDKYGYTYTEPNCMTICSECVICWDPRYRPSSQGGLSKLVYIKERLRVLNRRAKGYHGCKNLTQVGLTVRRELIKEKTRIEENLKLERKRLQAKIRYAQEQTSTLH